MGVKYDVIFKDGRRLPREAVCFGSMAGGQWSFGNDYDLCQRDPADQSMIQFYTANNIHPIWSQDNFMQNCREWRNSNAQAECKREANAKFLTEMKILLSDLPWMQDVLTIHPIVGVVRAHLKKHRADKIITSLFLIRNLCNYGETAACYRHFRAEGLRPRLCAIMASYMTKNFGAMNRCDFGQTYLGEYNWFNPQSFGKNAFIRMMTADKDTEFDFIQRPWVVQRGYRRDGFYRYRANENYDSNGPADVEDYNDEEGGWLPYDTRYISAESWDWVANRPIHPRNNNNHRNNCSHLYTRNLVDCYGISGDVPFDNVMAWNPVFGMTIFHHQSGRSSRDVVTEFVAELERVCMEAGVPSRFEV